MWKSNGDDFWIPSFKWQLTDWLEKHFPCNAEGGIINWKRCSKKQLLAIYIDKRRKYEQRKKAEEASKNKEVSGTREGRKVPEQIEFQF